VIPGYKGPNDDGNPGEVTVLEESTDGVHWTKPNLGLFEVNGSKDNNYILYGMAPFSHNFSPFFDDNPACPPDQKFKALAGTSASGLVAFVSPDGVHWKKLREEPVIAVGEGGLMFDSQNVACWSPHEKQYVAYCRQHVKGLRSILRATSADFLTWTKPEQVQANQPGEQLYTSQASSAWPRGSFRRGVSPPTSSCSRHATAPRSTGCSRRPSSARRRRGRAGATAATTPP
jgi:hypothetical protein